MLVTNAKVANYLGKSLNSGNEHSTIYLDPQIPQAHALQEHLKSMKGGLDALHEKVEDFERQMYGSTSDTHDKAMSESNSRLVQEVFEFCT